MWNCVDVKRVCEDVSVKMCVCEDVRCEDVIMPRCKMWRCMWRCEDMKMWRCEDVWQTQMTDPTIRRTLRSDALGNRNVDVHCFACEFMVLHDFSCSFMAFMWKHVLFIGVFLLFIFSFSWIRICWVASSGHLKKWGLFRSFFWRSMDQVQYLLFVFWYIS